MANNREPARRAYEAYSTAAGGRSLVSGDPLPGWDDLPEPIQLAWRAAADEVLLPPPEDLAITFTASG